MIATLSLTLVFVLALTSAASAECAWVLWSGTTPRGGYQNQETCEAARRRQEAICPTTGSSFDERREVITAMPLRHTHHRRSVRLYVDALEVGGCFERRWQSRLRASWNARRRVTWLPRLTASSFRAPSPVVNPTR
jgi:hypothetical protein